MQFSYKFRHMKVTDELTTYVEEHCHKLKKYELKPVSVTVTFTAERYVKRTDFYMRGPEFELRASAEGGTFFEAVDRALKKAHKQLARRKAKVQNHKVVENSHYGKIAQLNAELESVKPRSRRTRNAA